MTSPISVCGSAVGAKPRIQLEVDSRALEHPFSSTRSVSICRASVSTAAANHPSFRCPSLQARRRITCTRLGINCSFRKRNFDSAYSEKTTSDFTGGRMTHKVSASKNQDNVDSIREATLNAQRKERINLANYAGELGREYSIYEFLKDPSGVEAVLNTRAMQSFQPLDSHTYRCTLQKIQFMNFEVIPIIDLHVSYADNGCKIEMQSCKFEGSEILKQQNHRFSAFMMNHITWEEDTSKACLDFDVCLRVTLPVYTKPFTSLPISVIETPGNLIVQGLVDRLVPFLSKQLVEDYKIWVSDRSKITAR